MSKETGQWLRDNLLIGDIAAKGQAWWDANGGREHDNNYEHGIPVEHIRAKLYGWDPIQVPVSATYPVLDGIGEDGEPVYRDVTVTDPSRSAIVRPDTGTILGVHGSGYRIHGYDEWLTHTLADIVDTSAGELIFGSAGLLRGGAVAFAQIKTPGTVVGAGGQSLSPYLLAVTSLDGKYASAIKGCATRVVCDNTLAAGVAENGAMFKLKHTKHSVAKLANARDALGIIQATTDAINAEVEAMSNITVSDDEWMHFLDAYAPLPDEQGRGWTVTEAKRNSLSDLYYNDPRVGFTGTAYGVDMAVSTWEQHVKRVNKDGSRFERNVLDAVDGKLFTEEKRAMGILAGIKG